MAASAAVASCSLSSPSLTIDGRALVSTANVHTCSISRESNWKTTAFCRRIASNFVTKVSTGETTAEVVVETPAQVATESSTEVTTELPEVFKTIQEAWDKVEDKYAVASLGVAGTIALVGSTGVISAIDRLPLIPGVLELVGIGYTGWFAYRNLIFKPDRDAFLEKIKSTYRDIIG